MILINVTFVREQSQIIDIDAPEVAGWGPMGEIAPR